MGGAQLSFVLTQFLSCALLALRAGQVLAVGGLTCAREGLYLAHAISTPSCGNQSCLQASPWGAEPPSGKALPPTKLMLLPPAGSLGVNTPGDFFPRVIHLRTTVLTYAPGDLAGSPPYSHPPSVREGFPGKGT